MSSSPAMGASHPWTWSQPNPDTAAGVGEDPVHRASRRARSGSAIRCSSRDGVVRCHGSHGLRGASSSPGRCSETVGRQHRDQRLTRVVVRSEGGFRAHDGRRFVARFWTSEVLTSHDHRTPQLGRRCISNGATGSHQQRHVSPRQSHG